MSEEVKPELSRRKLLKASTVAAGAGAAGVAAAAVASPAQATDGQPVVQGVVNTGTTATTTIQNGSAANPALMLHNTAGAPLAVNPAAVPTFDAPVGSIFTDREGGIYTVGDEWYEFGDPIPTDKWIGRISPAFSTSVSIVTPERWLVTIPNFEMPNGFLGTDFVVPGSAVYEPGGTGRVMPKNSNTEPDLVLDFSLWTAPYGIYGVQGTLLIMSPVGNGFISLYDTDDWPGTSSMNYNSGQLRDGFTQMGLNENLHLNIKLSAKAIIVFDINAFIIGNGTGRLVQSAGAAAKGLNSGASVSSQVRPDSGVRRRAAK